MKKFSATLFGLALAVFLTTLPSAAQTGTVAKGPDESVVRDPEVEKTAKRNLDAARHYFRLKKAYVASLSRAEEILVAYPDFTGTDEALYIAGMSSLYLSEKKGKQAPPTSPPDKAQEFTPERLRATARFHLSRLVENHTESKFRKDAAEALKLLGEAKQ